MKQIIVDTNLLLLMVVGLARRDLIDKHKRTNTFTQEDYDLLLLLLEPYEKITVTPNILTETYNLAAQIGEPDRSLIMQALGLLIKNHNEVYQQSALVSESSHFSRLGLTDCGILELAKTKATLITTDLNLYLAASKAGCDAHNFNHLRIEYLLA